MVAICVTANHGMCMIHMSLGTKLGLSAIYNMPHWNLEQLLDLATLMAFLQFACLSRGSLQVLLYRWYSAGKVIGVKRNTTEGLAKEQISMAGLSQ